MNCPPSKTALAAGSLKPKIRIITESPREKVVREAPIHVFLTEAHQGEWRDEKQEERETTMVIIRKRGVTDKKLLAEAPKCVFPRQEVGGEVAECVFPRVFS
jgi:hypothetical protein